MSEIVMTFGLTALVVLAALVVLFNAYYQKAGRGFALIRTGVGKQRMVLDGGCLSLPFLHAIERIPTGGINLSVACEGERMLMTEDHIPVDLAMQFVVRVEPTAAGIQRAARAVGAANLNADDLGALFYGRFIDAMQAEISSHTLTDLHRNRAGLAAAVQRRLDNGFEFAGLLLESAALVRFDQAALSALKDNNALHVQGMRRIAEMTAEGRKKRAEIESDAAIAIRSTNLSETRDRVEFERQKQEAEINLGETVSRLKAESEARAAITAEEEARKSDEARLQRERSNRESEIERDLALRQREIDSLQKAEEAQIASRIALSAKRAEEYKSEAALETNRGEVVRAQEKTQAEKERLAAQRKREQAVLRAEEKKQVEAIAAQSAAANLLETTEAEARALELRARAAAAELQAQAGGRSAVIAAENTMDEKIIRMKLEEQKIAALPEVAAKISKPLEKIEGIRINHIGGPGFPGAGEGDSPSPFTETMRSILAMSVQLPALKKLGEEIGLDMDANLAARASDALSRAHGGSRVKGAAGPKDAGAGEGAPEINLDTDARDDEN
ncbi:MAG: SPFH domain-containing protein [Gammaproteobacteria bacterium]|nr:SPFH domain-containing protein [Gammaproteobacteria bacterium]